jgi:hypothetical protein
MKLRAYIFLPLLIVSLSTSVYATSIVFDASSSWVAGSQTAAQRAADAWGHLFSDPITINIKVNFDSLPGQVLGRATTPYYGDYYNRMLNFMVTDAADETSNAIVGSIPDEANVNARMSPGWDWDYYQGPSDAQQHKLMLSTSANLKAMGYTEAELLTDSRYNGIDATITFDTDFPFDYDNGDGLSSNTHDFESVVAHEIGHVLGFISEVDYVDWVDHCSDHPSDQNCSSFVPSEHTKELTPTPLDLFRFTPVEITDIKRNITSFTSAQRNMNPGLDAAFYDSDNSWAMSKGIFTGNGYQAGHWFHTSPVIGMMEPALGSETIRSISDADIRALDLIGWDLAAIPEPATLALMSTGLIAVMIAARRKKNRRKP